MLKLLNHLSKEPKGFYLMIGSKMRFVNAELVSIRRYRIEFEANRPKRFQKVSLIAAVQACNYLKMSLVAVLNVMELSSFASLLSGFVSIIGSSW
jgi:hypothetical protein